jgi:hypothetical protein
MELAECLARAPVHVLPVKEGDDAVSHDGRPHE